MGTGTSASAWRWRVFSATWASYFAYYFCRKPFYVTKGALEEQRGWAADDLALVGAAYLVAYTIGQFVAGAVGTRTGPRKALLVGMAITMVANGLFGFVDDLVLFGGLMVVNGLAQATGWSNNMGVMAFWTRKSERATILGFWGTNYQIGAFAATGLAAYLLGRFGLVPAYLSGSVVMAVALAWCVASLVDKPADVGLAAIPDDPDADPADEEGGWTVGIAIDVAMMGAFYFCIKFVRYAIWSWAPYIFETRFALDGDDAGYLSVLFDAGGFLGVPLMGWLSDRVAGGRRAPVAFGSVLAMVAACGLLFVGGSRDVTLCAISLFLVGLTLYGPDALMVGAGAVEAGSRRTAVLAVGIVNGMGSVGSVVQELVLGKQLQGDGGLGPAFATLLGSSVLALVALGGLLVRHHVTGRRG